MLYQLGMDSKTNRPTYTLSPDPHAAKRHIDDAIRQCGGYATVLGQLVVYSELGELKDDWQRLGYLIAELGELIGFLSDVKVVVDDVCEEAKK